VNGTSSYSVCNDTAKTFLISYCSAVYNELLRQCRTAIKASGLIPVVPVTAVHEYTDDVFYQFGGGAIVNMFKTRYNKIKTSSQDKEQISLEITVLQKLSLYIENDKILILAYLKYWNKGYMYFPCSEMLLFLRAVDTKEHTTVVKLSDLGTNSMKTVADAMDSNSELMTTFTQIYQQKYEKQCLNHNISI